MINIGDEICVTMLPSVDIYGKKYNETGGGGTVLEIKENSTIVKLFDGIVIEAKGTDFDNY